MIYGIDFDGTIVTENFPEIGEPIEKTVEFIRKLQQQGHKWILITMREGKYLDDAVEWLKAHGLNPDAVNDNLPERVEMWGNNPRKVYADIYIDDHNAGGLFLPDYDNDDDDDDESGFCKHMEAWDFPEDHWWCSLKGRTCEWEDGDPCFGTRKGVRWKCENYEDGEVENELS